MLDLGASVNLLPYSVYQQLGLGEMKPTPVTLQLADRSVRVPRGKVEDVLVQIDNFVYPVDFVVLDTCQVANPSAQTPIILGRPFLATSDAIIHCRNGLLNMTFGNMKMELNIFNVNNQKGDESDVHEVSVIDTLLQDRVHSPLCHAPMKTCLTAKEMDAEVDYLYSLLEKQDKYGPQNWSPTLEELPPMETKILPLNLPILDISRDEYEFDVSSYSCLVDIVNFCAMGQLPNHWDPQEREQFLVEAKTVFFDEPYLFKYDPPDDPSA